MSNLASIVDRLAEGDEEFDDELDKMSELNVIQYPPGTRVRILTGRDAGELGTVENSTRTMTGAEGERNYWVHLDYDEDPLSAVVYRPTDIQRVIGEDEEEDDDPKEIGQGYPQFKFRPDGSAAADFFYAVMAGGDYIGTLIKRRQQWFIAFVARRKVRTEVPIDSSQKGAELLWQDHQGIIKLPEMKRTYEPLVPPPDDPDHYESIEDAAKNLVAVMMEGDENEDFDDVKDYNYDQLDMITHALKAAGFNILRAERLHDELIFQFTWPAQTTTAYVNGWKRAQEAIQPYITLRQNNYAVSKQVQDGNLTATALIRKRIEEEPNLWKVVPSFSGSAYNSWHDIIFAGQKAGEVYLPSFGPGGDVAERLREELAELHTILPFHPGGWEAPGNAFGSGNAVEWWRRNRKRLDKPDRSKHFFDPKLTGE